MEINDNNIKSTSDSILNSSSIKSEYQRNNDILPRNVYKNDNLSVKAKEKAKEKTKVDNLPNLLKTFAVMTVALATGVGVINPIANTVSAELLEFGAYETGVYFVVSFSEYAEGLKAVLYNSFTDREIEITDSFAEGHFEDLASNMQYTFVIKQDTSVLIKKTITTKSIDDKYFYEDYDNGNQENIDDDLKEQEQILSGEDEKVDSGGEEEREEDEKPNIADDEVNRPQEEDQTEDLIGDDETGEDEESNEDDEFSEDDEKPDKDDVVDEEDSGEGDEENGEDEEMGDEGDEEPNGEEIVDDEEYNENEDETDEYDDSSNDEELDEEDEKLYENEPEPNLFMGWL